MSKKNLTLIPMRPSKATWFFGSALGLFSRSKKKPKWKVGYDRGIWIDADEYRKEYPKQSMPSSEELEKLFSQLDIRKLRRIDRQCNG